jgi:dTDP-4-dehydrorhamnose 3,5-epimerase
MSFKFEKLNIKGLVKVIPTIYTDKRGYFLENFNKFQYKQGGITVNFIQDNLSFSKKNVIRGLHYQLPPFEQDKLVCVMKGEILDIAVDIRRNSETFGKYEKLILSDTKREQFFIPKGFAHGFLVLSDFAVVQYKISAPYSPKQERGIIWNDSDLNIDWQVENPVLSDKDKLLPNLKEAEVFK